MAVRVRAAQFRSSSAAELLDPASHVSLLERRRDARAGGGARATKKARPNGCVHGCAGVTGWICESSDVAGLIAAIEAFMSTPAHLLRTMGVLARQKMEQEFDEELVLQAYLRVVNAPGDLTQHPLGSSVQVSQD